MLVHVSCARSFLGWRRRCSGRGLRRAICGRSKRRSKKHSCHTSDGSCETACESCLVERNERDGASEKNCDKRYVLPSHDVTFHSKNQSNRPTAEGATGGTAEQLLSVFELFVVFDCANARLMIDRHLIDAA